MSPERNNPEPIIKLNQRSRDVFTALVDTYLKSGAPVGSRTLSRAPDIRLSPASVRNVMSDLEAAGLLYAPHTSAGRLPTQRGLRLFVDGLLQLGELSENERAAIEGKLADNRQSLEEMLIQASELLSDLSKCAGMILAPKSELPLRHIEFVALPDQQALVVTVTEDGMVENRIIDVPADMGSANFIEATNYLNTQLRGRTLQDAYDDVVAETKKRRAELDELTAKVIEAGLATWAGGDDRATLIVRGRANLLEDVSGLEDLERIRQLFGDLDNKKELIKLLEVTKQASGMKIFIGSENNLFSMTGSSMIVAPYRDGQQRIIGAIGVIGPTHVNYARIIPLVDYTAGVVGRMIGS